MKDQHKVANNQEVSIKGREEKFLIINKKSVLVSFKSADSKP